jgi:hypothetical protein
MPMVDPSWVLEPDFVARALEAVVAVPSTRDVEMREGKELDDDDDANIDDDDDDDSDAVWAVVPSFFLGGGGAGGTSGDGGGARGRFTGTLPSPPSCKPIEGLPPASAPPPRHWHCWGQGEASTPSEGASPGDVGAWAAAALGGGGTSGSGRSFGGGSESIKGDSRNGGGSSRSGMSGGGLGLAPQGGHLGSHGHLVELDWSAVFIPAPALVRASVHAQGRGFAPGPHPALQDSGGTDQGCVGDGGANRGGVGGGGGGGAGEGGGGAAVLSSYFQSDLARWVVG